MTEVKVKGIWTRSWSCCGCYEQERYLAYKRSQLDTMSCATVGLPDIATCKYKNNRTTYKARA